MSDRESTVYVLMNLSNGSVVGVLTDLGAAERWKKVDPEYRNIVIRTVDDKALLASIKKF
jgi:hypothetical protein